MIISTKLANKKACPTVLVVAAIDLQSILICVDVQFNSAPGALKSSNWPFLSPVIRSQRRSVSQKTNVVPVAASVAGVVEGTIT